MNLSRGVKDERGGAMHRLSITLQFPTAMGNTHYSLIEFHQFSLF